MRHAFSVSICLVACFSLYAQTRIISHVTRIGGGFSTAVTLENESASIQAYRLLPYDSSGNPGTAVDGTLAPGQTISATVADTFENAEDVSHFVIEADSRVVVSAAYDFESGAGSPAQVASRDEQGSIWRLFPGNWNAIFDGFAVVNTGDVAADVWVHQVDLDGNRLKALKVISNLAPNAKGLYVIGDPSGSDFDASTPSYYEITADMPLAVTALRGTLRDAALGLLWSNDARVMSTSSNKRDEKGVWHIKNGDLYNVFEMMGYQVAVDRMWQLDLFRRNGLGRLAEFFGFGFVQADRAARAVLYTPEELKAQFDALPEDARTMIKAYADGTNRRIAEVNSNSDIMPFEYKSLGFDAIEPWNYQHVMAWMVMQQRTFSMENFGSRQIQNAARLQTLLTFTGGDTVKAGEMFNDFYWTNDPNAPTMIPATEAQKQAVAGKRMPIPIMRPNMPDMTEAYREVQEIWEARREKLEKVGAYIKGGSYAWVVNGEKSATGKPLLLSGPQINGSAPSPVCEGSIESDAITVSGMVIPGIPAVVIGRTPHHAWSFQVGHANAWDFYLEEQDSVIPRPEIIKVRNPATGESTDLEIEFLRTERAPIFVRQPLMSWKYALWGREFDLANGFLKLANATNMDEFGEGVDNLGASLHICYADKDGNIAYWMSGRTPVRPEGDYRFPQGFIADPLEWDIDSREPVPHDRNAARGWYGGWNNKASVDYDDHSATKEYGPFHRTHLINEFFENNDNITVADFKKLEFDNAHTFSVGSGGNPWAFLREYFLPVVQANPTEERMAAINSLEAWDGLFTDFQIPDTDILPEWVLTRDWLFAAMDLTFKDELGASGANPTNGTQGDLNAGVHWFNALLHVLDENPGVPQNYNWWSNTVDPNAPQTKDAIILAALDQAIAINGPGVRNINRFNHDLLGLLHGPTFLNRSKYTMIVEYGENGPTLIESMQALGQSGNILMDDEGQPIFDPNFYSSRDDFDNFIFRPFPSYDSLKK